MGRQIPYLHPHLLECAVDLIGNHGRPTKAFIAIEFGADHTNNSVVTLFHKVYDVISLSFLLTNLIAFQGSQAVSPLNPIVPR